MIASLFSTVVGFFSGKIKVILLSAALTLILALVGLAYWERIKNTRLEVALNAKKTELAGLQDELNEVIALQEEWQRIAWIATEVAKKREESLLTLRKKQAERNEKLAELVKTDPGVQEWFDAPLPGAVVEFLRNNAERPPGEGPNYYRPRDHVDEPHEWTYPRVEHTAAYQR